MLKNGQQIEHYKILSPIGAGGRGEFFLAEDSCLSRKVAIKILLAKISADAHALDRRAASALNHPNIITIHNIGEEGGRILPALSARSELLKVGKSKEAVREFEKIINHRGEASLSSIYPLAQLGKARALKDKTEYERFFDLWKDADRICPPCSKQKKSMKI
jgi:serine/threonine protein kinase